MRLISLASCLLLLSACGGGNDAGSLPGRSSGPPSGAAPRIAVPVVTVGERKSYDFHWDGSTLSVKSRIASLVDLTISSRDIRLQDITLSFDSVGPAGQLYRLYRAAFSRVPDAAGFGFWKQKVDDGELAMPEIATAFVESLESRALYGFPSSNDVFIEALYKNVLLRAPDPSGRAFWLDALQHGTSRASVLLAFAESAENKELTAAPVARGMAYAEPTVAYLPVAEAVGPTDVPTGVTFTIDGSSSSDANGDSLRYNWKVISGPSGSQPTITVTNPAKPQLLLDKPGRYDIGLTTDDGKSQSFSTAHVIVEAHGVVPDTGAYHCGALSEAAARDLYARGYTFLDRDKDGIPCGTSDVAMETTPLPVVDTGQYKCSSISHVLAVQLYQLGHTYLDRDGDGKPCENTDIAAETYVPPVISPPTTGQCWVNGYYRKNGTYVHGYWRRC